LPPMAYRRMPYAHTFRPHPIVGANRIRPFPINRPHPLCTGNPLWLPPMALSPLPSYGQSLVVALALKRNDRPICQTTTIRYL